MKNINPLIEELLKLQSDYIKFLTGIMDSQVVFLNVHGIKATTEEIETGVTFRNKINQLCEKLKNEPDQNSHPTKEDIKNILRDQVSINSTKSLSQITNEIFSLMPESNKKTEQPTDEEIKESRVCPCHYLDVPCKPNCSCIYPFSSAGCNYCATYGSIEQRKAMAKYIKYKLDFHIPTDKEIEIWADKHSLVDDPYLPNLCGSDIKRRNALVEGAKAVLNNEIPYKK